MRSVFVDTLHWLAVTHPRDPWHSAAVAAERALGRVRLVTTESVLLEYLAALREGGPLLRGRAVAVVRTLLSVPDTLVVDQTHDLFEAGLSLYEQRPDKGYSLVDCISFVVMRAEGIDQVLTNDHHFTQEGFQVLIHRRPPV